jgi:hypothetical protein
MESKGSNRALTNTLRLTATPLRSIAAGELGPLTAKYGEGKA